MTADKLFGRWSLIKHGRFLSDGRYVTSADTMRGQLIYSSDFSMSVLIVFGEEAQNPSDLIAYSGHFSMEGGDILHQIEVSPRLSRQQSTERRTATLSHDQLTLRTEANTEGYFEIVWSRSVAMNFI
jgi:Lipocalin-like domain